MPNFDDYEVAVLDAYEKGKLKSVATKGELAKIKAAARATAIKDRRVNIRLSSGQIQAAGISSVPAAALAGSTQARVAGGFGGNREELSGRMALTGIITGQQ